MHEKDFYANETSVTVDDPVDVRIEFVPAAGTVTVLRDKVPLLASEVIDAAVMNVAALRRFYAKTIEEAQSKGVLLSLHLKATMMKVSDSVMFGHCVAVYYQAALDKHSDTLKEIGANVNNGLAGVLEKLDKLPADKKAEIEAGYRRRLRQPPGPGHGRLAQRHHESPRAEQTSSSTPQCPMWSATVDACGTTTTNCRTPLPRYPTGVTQRCIRRSSRTAKHADNSIRQPWAACPTSV